MVVLRRIIALALFVLLLVSGWRFAAGNGQLIQVDYLLGEVEGVSLWLVLLEAFGLGVLVTALISLFELSRLGLVSRRYSKEIASLEAEVHHLRNLPLAVEGLAETEVDIDAIGEKPGKEA